MNGCLVRIGSRSQPYNHLRQLLTKACSKAWLLALPALHSLNTLTSNSKFESERVVPLSSIECMLDELAGWHVAGLGVMLLHQNIHIQSTPVFYVETQIGRKPHNVFSYMS
jgi:hypothetical protein